MGIPGRSHPLTWVVLLSNEPKKYAFVTASRRCEHQGGLLGEGGAKPPILGVPFLSLQTQKASTTIRPQGGVPCSESYKLNKNSKIIMRHPI